MNSPEFRPVKAKRLFTATIRYEHVDWNDWNSVIDAFREQMEGWYLGPARDLRKNGHFAFAVMSLCCTLVATLSQYYYGVPEGSGKKFIGFLDAHFPGFSANLSTPITSTLH